MLQQSEQRLMQEAYMYFHNTYPNMRGLFFRIKNEDHNRITGARNKATGVIPGVADSCLLVPGGNAIFIEFKIPCGKQSENQLDWEARVVTNGYKYYIIRSLDEFKHLCQTLDLL